MCCFPQHFTSLAEWAVPGCVGLIALVSFLNRLNGARGMVCLMEGVLVGQHVNFDNANKRFGA